MRPEQKTQLIHFAFPKGDWHFVNPHARQPMVDCSGLPELLQSMRLRRRAVDMGAHAGVLTQALAESFNHVEAFEPQPACHDCLAANLAAEVQARRVRLYRVALLGRTGSSFVNLKLKRDSQQGRVAEKSFPNAQQVPGAALDSYGWEDVDLIRIGPSADPRAVLAGARQTLAVSQPVIWIHLTADSDAGRVEDLRKALEETVLEGQGYQVRHHTVLLETGNEDLSQPQDSPAQESLPYGFARDSLMICPISQEQALNRQIETSIAYPSQAEETLVLSPAPANGPVETCARVGRFLFPSQMVQLPSSAGPQRLVRTQVAPKFTVSKPLDLPGGPLGAQQSPAAPEMAASIETLLAEQVLTPVSGGLLLTLAPEAAAVVDYVTVDLSGKGAASGCIFQGAPKDFGSVSEVRVDLPRAAVQDGARNLVVRFYVGAAVRHKRQVSLDLAQDHLAPHLVTCYRNRGGGGNDAIDALAASLGAPRAFAEEGARPGVAVVWGVLRGSKAVIDQVSAANGIFYYIDHAYFDRGHRRSYRITKNRFEAGPVREAPTDRLEALDLPLVPWRSGGREIIVCPPTDYFKKAHNAHDWLEQTLTQLKAHTDRPIVIREKPKPGEVMVPLPEALETAHALVTHSSNVAIEAAVMGTPVFVSESSAAAPVGLTDLSQIEAPVRPERWAWLAHLAYSQFSFEEMQSGAVWDLLRAHAARPLSSAYTSGEAGT